MSGDAAQRNAARFAYFVSWFVLSLPWLSGSVTIPYDAKALFQAQLQFLATALHEGQSPFWNPNVYLGFPQISDPQSLIFSPAILLSVLFKTPNFQVLDVYVMVTLGLGGLAILSLCLDKGWHPAAACIAAVCFMFGGTAAWRLQHIGHIQSYVAFAFSLWLLLRVLANKRLVTAFCAGIAMGMMLVEPNQVALLGIYSLIVVCLVHLWQARDRRQEFIVLLPPLVVAAVVCIAVAAVPIALTYLFLKQSNRPIIALSEAAHGSLHPASLLTFLVADLYGAKDPAVDYWGPYSPHWDDTDLTLSKNMCQVYFGALPALMFLGFGIVRAHLFDKDVRAFLIILATSILYAVGTFTPVYAVVYHLIPGISSFRRPVDATFIAGTMLAVLTGYLAHIWLTAAVRRASESRRVIEIALVAMFLLAAIGVAAWQSRIAVAWKPLSVSALWITVSVLALLIPVRILRRRGMAAMSVLVVLLTMDLGLNNSANGSTGVPPGEISDVLMPSTSNETIRFLKAHVRRDVGTAWRDRVELLGMGFDWQNCPSIHHLESTLGYNPFRIGLVSQALGARDYNVGADQRTFSPLFPSYTSPLADMLGLRYVVSPVPISEIDKTFNSSALKLVRRTKDGYIYENSRPLPRVLLVGESRTASFTDLLKHGRWPVGFDPRRTVLLDEPAGSDARVKFRPVSMGNVLSAAGDVTIQAYDNDYIVVRARTEHESYLVLNDVWHPWWFARVDGEEAPLLRANVLFRAVRLNPGEHVVRFDFRPLRGAWTEVQQSFFASTH